MKLESQVVSLELAKKLKELGVKQESLFVWSNAEWELTGELKQGSKWSIRERAVPEPKSSYSAFTVAELGEMLPKQIPYQNDVLYLQSVMAGNVVVYYGNENGHAYIINDEMVSEFSDTEANARAKILIYLIENNLITV